MYIFYFFFILSFNYYFEIIFNILLSDFEEMFSVKIDFIILYVIVGKIFIMFLFIYCVNNLINDYLCMCFLYLLFF